MGKISQEYSPKTLPLDHQIEAIEFIADQQTAALFDEQGLGKTKIIIDSLSREMEQNIIQGVMVVAPLSLVYNWEQEVLKHSYLLPIVIRGSKRERRYKLLTGANFYILNYETVVAQLIRMKRFCRSRKVAIVLDESARIKNPNTKTAQALIEIAPFAAKRIIVTGTPVANKPIDIWAQFYFLDQGKLLGSSIKEFKEKYNEDSPDYNEKLNHLRGIINANSIRRTKDAVLELPEKIYKNVIVELKGQQLDLYNKLRDELKIEITCLDGTKVIDEAENILKRLLRLVQLASNPSLVDKKFSDDPVKFPIIEKIVNSAVLDGDKIIIWSCFIENILVLKNRLKRFNPLIIYGDVAVAERAIRVAKFQNEGKNKVLIANPSAAKEGLTLTRANHAVYLDRNFSLTDYLQSQDRIHRISQTKRCIISKIIARNTIDEYIDRIIEFKSEIAKFVQGDSNNIQEYNLATIINKQSLLNLLGG